MTDNEAATPDSPVSHRVFVFQTAVLVHEEPYSDPDAATRLEYATPLDSLEIPGQSNTNWYPVRTLTGQTGFIRSTTKTITLEALKKQREEL